MKWRSRAACHGSDPNLFFPPADLRPQSREHKELVEEAIKVCADCPVRAECLADGMREEHGVWGGTTPQDREKLRRIKWKK